MADETIQQPQESKWWTQFRHKRWGWVMSALMTVLATLAPDLIRGFCLIFAVVVATATFSQTEFAQQRKIAKTMFAAILFLFAAVTIFLGARLGDRFSTSIEPPHIPTAAPNKDGLSFQERQKIVNNLLLEYQRTHGEPPLDDWVNQQLIDNGYPFQIRTQYEGSVDPSKPPLLIDNYGKVEHLTLLGGTMVNRPGAEASDVTIDMRPWFAFQLKIKRGELRDETHRKIETAVLIKKKEILTKNLTPQQRDAQLKNLDEIAKQLRSLEYNPEIIQMLLKQWKKQ